METVDQTSLERYDPPTSNSISGSRKRIESSPCVIHFILLICITSACDAAPSTLPKTISPAS